jgi:hypothetical protein
MKKKDSRQGKLISQPDAQPETEAMFGLGEFPYQLPDEEAYNAKRKREGAFEVQDEKPELA